MNSDTSMPSPESVHISVLLNEAVDALAPKAGGRYLDGTVGMGGHSFAIMERTGGEGFLCGLDRDTQALELARIRLAPFGDRVHLVHTRYSEFEAALDGIGWDAVDGALIDIGVSSLQIDSAERGFSFSSDGPLDMRMDRDSEELPVSRLVNRAKLEDLKDIIERYGEDPQAGRIARAIVEARVRKPIETTGELVDVIKKAGLVTETPVIITNQDDFQADVEGNLPRDIKRGDIGSTSAAYAVGHLGHVQVGSKKYAGFDEDFATVNPYLGSDGVKPFIDVCKEENKGLFILVKTSNPSSGEFQDRLIDGRPLYEWVGEKVAEWGKDHMGKEYSYIGAVVGATYPEMGKVLRKLMPKTFILVPGYGAQGGKGADLVHFFNEDGLGAIVNSSRGIIAAYKQEAYAEFGELNYADASRKAVEVMIEDISGALKNR